MSLNNFFREISKTHQEHINSIQKNKKVALEGLVGSAFSFFSIELFNSLNSSLTLVLNNKEEAAYVLNDLEELNNNKDILFYPASYRRPYDIEEIDNANILLRSEVLNRFNDNDSKILTVTYPEALFEKIISKNTLEESTLSVKVNDKLSIDFINETLFEYDFKRVDFVTEPGEFSLRGGILDVFSFSNDLPFRIEFFGDEIDSIRTFDIETQLSVEKINQFNIIPNISKCLSSESRQNFFKYIDSNSTIIIKDRDFLKDQLNQLFDKAEQIFKNKNGEVTQLSPKTLFVNGEETLKALDDFKTIDLTPSQSQKDSAKIKFNTTPQPSFNKQFNLLIEDLNLHHDKGYKTYIACSTEQQAKRFHDIFENIENIEVHYKTIVLSIHEGFINHDAKILCYTDHQIFERYKKFKLKNGYEKKQSLSLKELNELEVGDFVTHIDHGIGKFGGLQKIKVEDKDQEAIKLIYGERDILYVSIHSLHKVSKYTGKDGKPPKINKLGSKAWKTLKQKTKTKVKEIAFSLIQLYAKRKTKKGFQYEPDSYLQHELEASFIYEDTPDQSSATADVKADMESERPMDRLVCGDVGFGKTEVAIRAAFKAVDNGKQVAVLVPTTILAYQHFKTFSERLKELPVTVNYLNRFRTAKEKREILSELEEGKIDIIIGTHQLVNKAVKFKDIGLLIVDEEQKFGVGVKDKLKTFKEDIDVLTLTATPIPRTLQFSLMAARDLSTIQTPPPNRYPIESKVVRFSEETVRDAISYEIQRGGQAFFIHNRIENIKEVAGMIQRLVPDAKVGVGHGQMDGKKLEATMLDFMNGEFDVLVSTTIIESGLDVPNANTIFINSANNFGLSDLHQMRGRVGRSNKKAFCYFITPEHSAMTDEARKRMSALAQFTELGSGFNIAMKDLEIRGAGDLLGGEQSGFIGDIGFDTYQKILNEAIEELKENEFKDLYADEQKEKKFISEVTIDSDFSLLFPDDYINSIKERLALYTKLNNVKTEEELKTFEKDLIDRFGELPPSAIDLLDSLKIKWLCIKLGIEKIIMKQNKLIGYFISNQQSEFYQSSNFMNIISFIQKNPSLGTLKEKETRNGLRLLLSFNNITSVSKAIDVLEKINN